MSTATLAPPSVEAPPEKQVAPPAVEHRHWMAQPYVLMTIVALLLRVGVIIFGRTYLFPTIVRFTYAPELHNFMFGYETGSIARSIAVGHGFSSPFGVFTGPTAWIAPIYTYLCAGIFKLFGVYSQESAIVILIINSLFSALTCVTIYKIAERTVGRTVGLWAGWAWAVVPFFMRWPTTWVWEISLSALLMSGLFLYTLHLEHSSSRKLWAGYGLLWAVAALSNPALLAALPFMGLWAALRLRRRHQEYLRPAALSALVFFLAIAPWLVRNRIALGQWVFIRDNFALELRLGNYPSSNGMGWLGRHPTWNKWQLEKYVEMGELAYLDANRREALEFIRSQPMAFLVLCGKRFLGFWDGTPLIYHAKEPWKPWMIILTSVLALYGLVAAIGHKIHASWLYALVLLTYPIPYYITYAQPRYRHAIEPLLLLLIVYFLWEAILNLHRRFTRMELGHPTFTKS